MRIRWIILIGVVAALAMVGLGWSAILATQRPSQSVPTTDMWSHVPGRRKPWRPVGRLDTDVIRESSGIIASRQHDGIFWTHSDSFNEAEIFAITEDGAIVARVHMDAPNRDWEDIAADDDGFLYIADIGNNLYLSARRHIYKIREPDPYHDDGLTVQPVATYSFSYPDRRFDAEAFFVRAGRMFVVSRNDRNRARIYALEFHEYGPVTLHEVAALRAYRANAADLSADGTTLAVCTTRQTWLYSVDRDMVPVEGAKHTFVRYPNDQVEGCCWEGHDLVLTNERGRVFRISADDIAHETIFVPPSVINGTTSPMRTHADRTPDARPDARE